MRRWWWLVSIIIAGVVAAGAQVGGLETKRSAAQDNETLYKELELFEQALSLVRSDYVEQPDSKQLIYGALKGMLATLDPYSQFMDPDSYNELRVETEGAFGGLGVEITVKDDLLTVISPIDDTPAARAGLQAGDRIVKIDGEITRGITLLDAVKKLRGKPGTSVALTLLREGENALVDVTITRDTIKVQSVREAKFIDGHIGYIRLSDFRENTPHDLSEGIAKLKAEALDGVILDLRNNPGGLLDVAVSVTEQFLDRSQIIVTTKGRLRNQNLEFRSDAEGSLNGIPLVVLINQGSASASEIVAGAIQDHHRGVIMGTKSHGKGSVQTVFPLKDGSALRLTTSKWFTPSGRPIHGVGITPDVEVPLERPPDSKAKSAEEAAEALFDRVEAEDPSAEPAEEKPLDNQLARAVDLLKGIKVLEAREKATP